MHYEDQEEEDALPERPNDANDSMVGDLRRHLARRRDPLGIPICSLDFIEPFKYN